MLAFCLPVAGWRAGSKLPLPRRARTLYLAGSFAVAAVVLSETVLGETMVYRLKAADEEEALDKLQQFNLLGVAEKVECPLLVIQGRRDRLVPAEQGERIAAEVGSAAELWMFEDGNHVCNNIPYKHRPQQADWMSQKLYRGV